MTEYECPKCGKRLVTLVGIKDHMAYMHKVPTLKRKLLMRYFEDNEGVRGVLRAEDLVNIPDIAVSKSELKALTGHHCQFCGRTNVPRLHVHHIAPTAAGGPDTLANLIVLCPICHDKAHQWQEESKTVRGEPRGLSAADLKRVQQNYIGPWYA